LPDSSSIVFIDGKRKINLPRRLHAKCFTEFDIPVNRMHGAGGDIVGFRVEQGRTFLSIGISDSSLAPGKERKETRTKQGLDVDYQIEPMAPHFSSQVPDLREEICMTICNEEMINQWMVDQDIAVVPEHEPGNPGIRRMLPDHRQNAG
jgi:hypothetical protein